MRVGLEALASYFPETAMKREDFSYLDPVIPKGMEKELRGPDELRRFSDFNAVEIMAEKVAQKVLASAGLKAADIDYLIAANFGGKYVIPMVGTWIHHQLELERETPVLNIQNCCASFVDACNVAWNFICAGEYKRILVVMVSAWNTGGGHVSVDQTTPFAKFLGDGAGAAIVSSENLKCEFLSYTNRTFGEIYNHIATQLRPSEHPELQHKSPAQAAMGNYLYADEWFYEWQHKIGKSFALEGIKEALKKAGITLSDLDWIVIHQAFPPGYEEWIKGGEEAGISRDKWKETWSKYSNIGNVDIVPNLEELWQEGKLKKGSIIALFPPGGGGHTPCMIIRWLV